jgi:6-phosphogluconolactonase
VYFSNEQGCSVTAYRLDPGTGALSPEQTISTLPAGHSERTTCSQIHLTPSGRFLYVGNRALNSSSIAAFATDPATGRLTTIGQYPPRPYPARFASIRRAASCSLPVPPQAASHPIASMTTRVR